MSYTMQLRGTFGKFLAWSLISVTNLQTRVWYHFKELSFLCVMAQVL